MAAINYGTYDCTFATATTAGVSIIITHSNSGQSICSIHPGYTADDGRWFSDQKQCWLWNNIIYEKSLWKKQYYYYKPIVSSSIKRIHKVITCMSNRQRYKQKRKLYLQKLEV